MMQREVNGEITICAWSLILVYHFDTIVGVREPNYGDVCMSVCKLVFTKTMFLTNEM